MKYSLYRKRCVEYIGSVSHKQRALFAGYFVTLLCFIVVSYLAIAGVFGTLGALMLVLIFLLIWVASIEIVFLLQDVKLITILLAVSVVITAVAFVRSVEALIGVIIFAICCAESLRRIKHERRKSINTSIGGVMHPLKHILPIFVLGVCFLLASFFVAFVLTPDSTPEKPIPKHVFNSVFEPVEQLMQTVFSDYDSSLPIDEVQELVVQNVFGGEWIEENIGAPTQQDIRPLREYLYDTINSAISTPLLSFFKYVSIFGTLVLFVMLRLLFIVLLWVSYFVSYIVIKLLLRYGIILIDEQPSTHQRIQFT